jgi:hypothetical protein
MDDDEHIERLRAEDRRNRQEWLAREQHAVSLAAIEAKDWPQPIGAQVDRPRPQLVPGGSDPCSSC